MNCSLFTETEKAYAVTLYEPRKLIRERTRVLQNAVQLYFSARIFAIILLEEDQMSLCF